MKTETFPAGDSVVCDFCSADWTDSNVSGGFLFQSKAVCPQCALRTLPSIQAYGEERFIREWCPKDMSFSDWVRRMRYATKNDKIIIITTGS